MIWTPTMQGLPKYNTICALKYKLNQILSSNNNRAFTFVRQKYFEFGDKPHKLLARQLKKLENSRMIYKIRSRNGNLVTSHKDINDNFRQFHESLYTSHSTAGPKDMQDFLDRCDLPVLDQMDRKILNAKITTEEITKSTNLLITNY